MRSGVLMSASVLCPAGTVPGYRMTNGTMIDSSHGFCLWMRPWLPSMSPWSEVNTRIVSSATPFWSRASMIRPKHRSSAVMCE